MMNTVTPEIIQADVLKLLHELARDWEYSGEITPDTWLFGDLGFESIDAVVLASFVQEHYGRTFPFPQLLAEIGQREVKDLRISELVAFMHQHLNGAAAGAGA
ncbi:MAG: phosphopantetheine-binding protein [Candidatus Solibacter sp.]